MFDVEGAKVKIIKWIRDFYNQEINKDACAVIGISGGKDSSVAAALCVEALGKDRVVGLLLPQGDQHDFDFAQKVVKFLGIKYHVINIKETVDALTAAFASSNIILNRPAIVNTPARVRMTALYALAATVNGRVVNTCNASEDYVGYSTKFGDSAGDFAPIANLTVTEVRELGRALGLPEEIVCKTPEDGLSGLSDEENLGFTYDVLDKYIRTGVCDDLQVKAKIDKLYKNSRHKVELLPMAEV